MPTQGRDRLRASLFLLAAVLGIALIGLAVDGNWPKVLRVAAAGAVYAVTLLVIARQRAALGWWGFALAGLAAGAASGWLRPDPGVLTLAIDAFAAMVVAMVHWLGLAQSERLRRKLEA